MRAWNGGTPQKTSLHLVYFRGDDKEARTRSPTVNIAGEKRSTGGGKAAAAVKII